MHRQSTIVSKCLHLTIIITLTAAKIIPTYHNSPTEQNEETDSQNSQTTNMFSNLNPQQMNELEKLVRQSLENIFKNEELTNYGANNFGMKTADLKQEVEKENEEKIVEPEVDYSSPHILKVPVPQPYPVHVPVKQPFTVPIFKLVPEEIEKKVPIPVQKLVPIYKEKPVEVIVEKHHPVHVLKPYIVPVPVNTHVLIDKKKQFRWY